MNDDALNDICTAVANLRLAFRKHNIPVPDQLSYSDPLQARDAKMALYSIPVNTRSGLMSLRISQKSPHTELEIAGINLLWT